MAILLNLVKSLIYREPIDSVGNGSFQVELLENVKRSAYSIPTQRSDLYRNVLT